MANNEKLYVSDAFKHQVLVSDSDITSVDNIRTYQGASLKKYFDISSQTMKVTKNFLRSNGNANPLLTYIIQENSVQSNWVVDLEDSTTLDDNYTCIVTGSGVRVKRIIADYYNILDFGADRSGLSNSSTAVQRAVDHAADNNGGTILIPNGRFRFDTGVIIDGSGIYIKALGKQGKQFASVPDRDRGTYIFPGADMSTSSFFNFTVAPSGLPNRSCGVIDVSFIGGTNGAFFYPVDSAVRIARSDQFNMTGCSFERIQGRGIHVSGTIKSCFTDIDVFQSGDAGKPAVDIGAVEGPVQGSFFDKFRIESCFTTYVKVGSAGACIYDNFVFETAPTSETQQIMLDFGGTSSQFGKCRFNKTNSTSPYNKAIISGNGNMFDSMLFDGGHSETASALLISGQGNTVTLTSDGGTSSSASIENTGNYNTIDANIRFSGGIKLGGILCSAIVRQVSSTFANVLSGTECSLDIKIDGNATAASPLHITGTRCDVKAIVTDCASATSAIHQNGNGNTILSANIRNCPNGIEINGGTRIGNVTFAGISGQNYVFTSGNISELAVQVASGSTALRPVTPPVKGYMFFDTTLGKPIYWNGTAWVDSSGTLV